jgi:hypothetical protein
MIVSSNGKAIAAEELKRLASGRWLDVLESVAGIDRDLVDGRHHP